MYYRHPKYLNRDNPVDENNKWLSFNIITDLNIIKSRTAKV